MTQKEIEQFLRIWIGGIVAELVTDIPKIPREWNGAELKNWANERVNQVTPKLDKHRQQKYDHEIVVRNL